MSRERGPEQGAQIDPYQVAVNKLDAALAAPYDRDSIASAYSEAQSLGLQTVTSPLDFYTQSVTRAGQIAELAEQNSDPEFVTRFRGEQAGFQRTVDALPKPVIAQAAPRGRARQSSPRTTPVRRATGRATG